VDATIGCGLQKLYAGSLYDVVSEGTVCHQPLTLEEGSHLSPPLLILAAPLTLGIMLATSGHSQRLWALHPRAQASPDMPARIAPKAPRVELTPHGYRTDCRDVTEGTRQGPAHDRECIALHTACAYHGVIGVPSDGHSAQAHEQRDASQVLRPCDSLVESPPDWTMGRELDEDVQQDSVCHGPWLPTLVVEQARPLLCCRCLIAQGTGH
jgi:hypothetical protein